MATALNQTPVNRRSALVVDDSRIARNVLSRLLMKLGFDVEVAHSAESALKQLAGPLPDVVFMDHALPGMDGLNAVSRLRAQTRTARLPIVMYTSQDSDAFASAASTVGADDVYPKTAEHSVLRNILTRLSLIPDRPVEQSAKSAVNRPPGKPAPRQPAAPRTRKLTRGDLVKLLEPSLAAHHAKLHQDLLAEFAILERYEERMRRDLFARVDALASHATDSVDHSFAERRIEREHERRGRTRRWWAAAAVAMIALGASVALSWTVAQRNQQLELQGASMLAAIEAQQEAISDLNSSLLEVSPTFDSERVVAQTGISPADRDTADSLAEQDPTAAAALVAELQAMGILGPIRIETSAGSFCISSTTKGFQIEVSNLALEHCETLPLRLAATNWE